MGLGKCAIQAFLAFPNLEKVVHDTDTRLTLCLVRSPPPPPPHPGPPPPSQVGVELAPSRAAQVSSDHDHTQRQSPLHDPSVKCTSGYRSQSPPRAGCAGGRHGRTRGCLNPGSRPQPQGAALVRDSRRCLHPRPRQVASHRERRVPLNRPQP